MLYDRKIKYLDYYERGERVKGCGFVKLEIRESVLKLELNVRGLHPTDSFSRDVVLKGKDTETVLGQITFQQGSGNFSYTCQVEDGIGHTGIPYGELREIRVSVGASRELCCSWEKMPERAVEKNPVTTPVEENPDTPAQDKNLEQENQEQENQEQENQEEIQIEQPEQIDPIEQPEQKDSIEQPAPSEELATEQSDMPREDSELQAVSGHSQSASAQSRSDDSRLDRKPTVKLMESKWQQLSAIYPHVRPFEDDRDYISISPSDFVIFPTRFYKAANNSFLLHGYYNYKHLILARVEHRNDIVYYLGVPGNYYDREKQVAVMFGFESFECAQEPAKTGDFGYYMMRMDL